MDDFLAALKAKRRKEVRRERRRAQCHGLDVSVQHAAELTAEDWDSVYACYRNTVDGYGQYAYLTRSFFDGLTSAMGERVLLGTARFEGKIVACSLNFQKGNTLFGRYWGCVKEHESMHFELCYYLLIEYAIDNNIERFEAGAQGEHKISRGFLPVPTYSAHWMADSRLHDAVSGFCAEEFKAVETMVTRRMERSPYRQQD